MAEPKVCPRCGLELEPVVGPPDWAPWLCPACRRGYWDVELSEDVRGHYDPRTGDLAPAKRREIADAVEAERALAFRHRSSLREDHLDSPRWRLEHLERADVALELGRLPKALRTKLEKANHDAPRVKRDG